MDESLNPVPMVDLQSQYRQIKSEVDEAIARVVASQHFINGPDVAHLEEEVARYSNVRHCVGVSSGTDALLIALMALDIGPDDEVITSPYTFFATVGAIARLGARPVFVDIDPVTFNLDPRQLESRITPRTRAVIPVHLYGQCAEMEPILEIAARHHLAVIEDAAQAIGAEYGNRRAGSMGTFGCFSFFPSKNLGAFGDGGAVVTNDSGLADKLRCLRSHGSNPKYYHRLIGGNFRLDSLQAAVLRVKLRYLDSWTEARQGHAHAYTTLLLKAGLAGSAVQPPKLVQTRHIFNQYVVRAQDRDAVRAFLKQRKIESEIYYPLPMHLQDCFASLGHRVGDFPESEKAAVSTLALPMHPDLTATQQQRVVQGLRSFYDATGRQSLRHAA